MTEFKERLRHFCRNPKCRMKLPQPVANEREGFCCLGCYESFYLNRCHVCDQTLEAKYRKIKPKEDGEAVKFVKVRNPGPTCGDAGCKRRWRDKDGTGRFSLRKRDSSSLSATPVAGSADLHSGMPANEPLSGDLKEAFGAKRPWRIIAGPELTASQFHCATVPDGEIIRGKPSWSESSVERIEAKNHRALEAHFDKLDAEAVANDFCAACGRTDDLTDHRIGDRWVTYCYDCHHHQPETGYAPAVQRLIDQIPADLSIPAFLRRDLPQADQKLAA